MATQKRMFHPPILKIIFYARFKKGKIISKGKGNTFLNLLIGKNREKFRITSIFYFISSYYLLGVFLPQQSVSFWI
jgi:hypothetical protein